MSRIKLSGWSNLDAQYKNWQAGIVRKITDQRALVVEELVERLIENIPVWSGRTIASLWVSKSGEGMPPEPHPQRGGFAIEGEFHMESAYGMTSKMGMGSEPMRGGAEARARAQAAKARTFGVWDAPKITVTINSVPWKLIEQGKAPGGNVKGRNRAVVSAIAIASVRAKFAGIVK